MPAKQMCVRIREHDLQLAIDDATWEALEKKAGERHETPGEVVVYAIEQFMEREGFVPEWALVSR
jgi:hypothetical protein